jgi:hypothetical protein
MRHSDRQFLCTGKSEKLMLRSISAFEGDAQTHAFQDPADLARISHTASSRDVARNCPRSRCESERIEAKRRCGAGRRREAKSTWTERSEVKRRQLARRAARRAPKAATRSRSGSRRAVFPPSGFPAERFPPSGSRRAVPAERHEKRGLESRNGCNALCRVRLARISRRSRHQHHKRVSFCPTRRKSREVVALRPEIRRHPPPSLP